MSLSKRKLIGIAGASGSGKTTLARRWAAEMGAGAVLSFDSYYHSLRSDEDLMTKNFDHPAALDDKLFHQHLKMLKAGESVSVPRYDFAVHMRVGEDVFASSCEYVFIEGILLLHVESIRNLLDITFYVDTPFEICVERRLNRDCRERGRTSDQALAQIRATVEPMYHEYVAPSSRFADYVIPYRTDNSAMPKFTGFIADTRSV